MGVIKMFSSSSGDKSHCMVGSSLRSSSKYDNQRLVEARNKSLPNPDPTNYRIKRCRRIGDYLIVKIKYLDCTNYEGIKILVFKTTIVKLKAQKYIDPHFCDNKKFISPIARFEPTDEGWKDAVMYVRLKNKKFI